MSTIIKGLIKFCCPRFTQGPGTWVPTLDLGPLGADQGPAWGSKVLKYEGKCVLKESLGLER